MPQFRRPARTKAPTIHQSFARSCWRMPSSTAYLERNGGARALAAGERDAPLADHRVVALRQLVDELVRLREPRDPLDLRVGEIRRSERDVLPDRRREEERILGDDADGAPQRRECRVAHI